MKKQILTLLAFTILFSGCSAQNSTSRLNLSSSSQAEPSVAMGRYIEKDIQTPYVKNNRMSLTRGSINITSEGNITVHTRAGMCSTVIYQNGQWDKTAYRDEDMLKPVSQKYLGTDESSFRSEDNAKPFIHENIMIGTGEIIGPDGYTFITATYSYNYANSIKEPQIPEKSKTEHFCVSYNGKDARYYDIPELINSLKNSFGNENAIYTKINRISRQNVLILSNKNEYVFYDLSVDGGKKLGALPNLKKINDESAAENLAIIDDIVLVADESGAAIFTLSTGEEVAKVALEGIQKVCEGVDKAFYAFNKEGIWRILPQGGIVQRVIDGSTYSFSAPAFSIKDFTQDYNGSFYIIGNNDSMFKLFKYEFSQNTPLEREKTLHLWSYKDNPTIREASAEYMRRNPEVKVYIEIVPKDIGVEKATEALISALLAGTGPDLINTDGIELAKLDAQSVLAPISTEVNLLQYDKRLLSYGQLNNRQIAIGTKLFAANNSLNDTVVNHTGPFNIEHLLISAKAETKSIRQLRETAGNNEMIKPLLAYNSREEAFNTVYTASSAEIWQNGFSKNAAEVALQLMNEIENKFINFDNDFSIAAKNNLYVLNELNNLSSEANTAGLYGKANLVLSRMISYSANTQNEDLCIDFLNIMLSDYVQTAGINDGRAVTDSIKLSTLDNDYKENIQNVFALDCLVRQSTGEMIELSPDAIQIITENYTRDDGFKAIAYGYLDCKTDLKTSLLKAEKLQ